MPWHCGATAMLLANGEGEGFNRLGQRLQLGRQERAG
jgi:hypothetical protein